MDYKLSVYIMVVSLPGTVRNQRDAPAYKYGVSKPRLSSEPPNSHIYLYYVFRLFFLLTNTKPISVEYVIKYH